MSKSVTTRWYIGAWVVGAISMVAFFMTAHTQATSTNVTAIGTSPIAVVAWLLVIAASIVMLVMWIGALIRLGQLGSWGWLVLVLVLQLIGLGIVGMAAYAVAGPSDVLRDVTRPSVT